MGFSLEQRAFFLGHFIEVAVEAFRIQNYHLTMSIISALNSVAITRLKRTWALVEPRLTEAFKKLDTFFSASGNYAEYRQKISECTPPCIPFLGPYVQDLTFIDDGNPDFHDERLGLINWEKCELFANVIYDLTRCQTVPYYYTSVKSIQEYLESFQLLEENALWEVSVALEPKITTNIVRSPQT
eukprot:TRINITY_DN3355_c0_g1_i3.p1 TRINITY_DN3355_c0_g1~~TRINITY_DN3355_c0_g1_i3.p1  ORF type:complete len:185 (+),score=25.33 TRINITY_DN3355_c0_g1_i3:285-839(+)